MIRPNHPSSAHREASGRLSAVSPYIAITAILLTGTFLIWRGLGPTSVMLNLDEGYYAMDAVSLMQSPRLTPFLPANYGRESLWCYILIPFVAVFGARPFALHIASTIVGILTIAALYRMGKEVLPREAALWASLALGVAQWHVLQSQIAMRAVLFPLVGTMAFAALMKAHRTGKTTDWMYTGVWTGLLLYTYFSAVVWIACILLTLAVWWLREPTRRSGPTVAALIAVLLFLPMVIYGIQHPGEILGRSWLVRISHLSELWVNVRIWAQAWFYAGNPKVPYDPNIYSAVGFWFAPLFLAGIGALWWAVKRKWQAPGLFGLMLFSVAPSLFSRNVPYFFLRAIGVIIPVALVIGAGAWAVEKALRRIGLRYFSALIPLIFYLITAITTYYDCYVRWVQHPAVFLWMEQHINRAADLIRTSVSRETPVYFSPFTPSHPVISFRSIDLAPRHVGAFDSHICLVVPETLAVYVSVTLYEPDFQQRLSRWAETTPLTRDAPASAPPYAVFLAQPHVPLVQKPPAKGVFGERVELLLLSPLSSTVAPGETIPVELALKALRPSEQVYSVFIHLYGEPTPYEGGPLWAQADQWVCAPYPSPAWKTNEWIIQMFSLNIPEDIPPGRYLIAAGVYESQSGTRLSLPGQEYGFLPLQQVDIQQK